MSRMTLDRYVWDIFNPYVPYAELANFDFSLIELEILYDKILLTCIYEIVRSISFLLQ